MIKNITIHLTQTKTQKVGTLAIKNKKIYFEYDKAFLKTGIELSPYKLPLKAEGQGSDPIKRIKLSKFLKYDNIPYL